MRLPKVTLPFVIAISVALVASVSNCFAAPEKQGGKDGAAVNSAFAGQPDASHKNTEPAVFSTKTFAHPYGYHLEPILDRIQADAAQRKKITLIVESFRSTIEPLREKYKEKQQEFIQSMTSGAPDETIMQAQVELAHLFTQISSNYTMMRVKVRRLLTPSQIVEFEAYRKEHGWTHNQ